MDTPMMSEREMAAFQLVGTVSWIYDTGEPIPESYRPEVKRLLKIAMPKWKPAEDQ